MRASMLYILDRTIFSRGISSRLPPLLEHKGVCMLVDYRLGIEFFDNRPWESVERYFQETAFEEQYGGWVYFSTGANASP